MELEAYLHGIGIKRSNRYFEDCLQEAHIALLTVDPDSTEAYKRQSVKWAVYNYLRKQLSEDYRVFKLEPRPPVILGDRVITRLACSGAYRKLTATFTPFERMVYVLCVASPLNRRQIADTFDVSDQTVSRIFQRAQEKIAALDKSRPGKKPSDATVKARYSSRAVRCAPGTAHPLLEILAYTKSETPKSETAGKRKNNRKRKTRNAKPARAAGRKAPSRKNPSRPKANKSRSAKKASTAPRAAARRARKK